MGRKRELEDIIQMLRDARAVTLLGPAGIGKTRLALEASRQMDVDHASGIAWVELAPLAEPSLVAATTAHAVGVRPRANRDVLDALLEAIEGTPLLIVLDNCEHLVNACAALVSRLIADSASTILTTSREALGISGESIFPIQPLRMDVANEDAHDAHHGRADAVELFVQRARSRLPDFALTPTTSSIVSDICQRLDGVPLAIEVAAAQVDVLSLEQILARTEDPLAFDRLGAPRGDRYASLTQAIASSYVLLDERERAALRALSVFPGDFSLSSAEAACEGVPGDRPTLEVVSSLTRKSLVTASTLREGEARYKLLSPIREFARRRLAEEGNTEGLAENVVEHFTNAVETASSKMHGPYQRLWLRWIDTEHANLRFSLTTALAHEWLEAGLRICIALYPYWTIRDHTQEGLAWLERLLARPLTSVPPGVHARALAYASFLAGFRGRASEQAAFGRQAQELLQDATDVDHDTRVWALTTIAYAARATGDTRAEFATTQEVVRLRRASGDPLLLGIALSVYSIPAMALRKFDLARTMLDEAMAILEAAGDRYRIAMAWKFRGDLERCIDRYGEARDAYERSASILAEIGAERDRASVARNLGHARLRLGDWTPAYECFEKSMAFHSSEHNVPGIASSLVGYACLVLEAGLARESAVLLAAAEALGGRHVTSIWPATAHELARCSERARRALSVRELDEARAQGVRMSPEVAARFAHAAADRGRIAHEARDRLAELTPRETQVASLIAQGLGNGAIAQRLGISTRTVETHVSNIRSKLGTTERTEIVRWVFEAGSTHDDPSA